MVLCRYCGKEMTPRLAHDTGVGEYYCDCEDWVRDAKLTKEIYELEKSKLEKIREQNNLRHNSRYCNMMREIRTKVENFKRTYSEGGDWNDC